MKDELPALLDRMLAQDMDKFGLILNKSPSTKDGTHWTAIWVDLDENKQICYYDPFGEAPQKSVTKDLKDFVKKRGLPYMVKFKINKVVHQAGNSNRCGYHCAKYLIHMFKTGDFESATDFDTNIRQSEKEVSNLEKKYRTFGYI
jgi:hypothetical protein